MKNQRFLKLLLGLAMGTLVLLVAYVDLRQSSPGPISRVHLDVADLGGRSGCADCHGGWGQEMGDACLECHEPVQEHLDARIGLHGNLDATQAQACGLCHSEHHGPAFALTNFKSFALASGTSAEDFDHAFVGFGLEGEHAELSCVECHESADVERLQEGQQRYMGLSSNCASCHDDPHEGSMQRSCADCHVQLDFEELSFVKHDDVLRLEGAHAGMDCRACHGEGEQHSLEALPTGIAQRNCKDCHDSPHSPRFERGNARLTNLIEERNCITCHAAGHLSFDDPGLELTPRQHGVTGFKLGDPHAELDCSTCHAAGDGDFELRFPGRDAQDCAACHADPHAGQFDASKGSKAKRFEGKRCIDCHARTEFEPHVFDLQKHAQTNLPLDGAHAETECTACHQKPQKGKPRQFRGTDLSCAACHDDVHRGVFDAQIKSAELEQHGQCALCHGPTSFGQVADFDHGLRTSFPIRGAHAASACSTCHADLKAADAEGRHFERVPDGIDKKGCSLCHQDPHQGVFRGRGLPREVDGRSGCARCHVEHSFRELEQDFEHGSWTGFELSGGHGELTCSQCHTPLRRPDANGLTWQHAAGASCGECHASPHAGQFIRDGRSDCARCHSNASSFEQLTFDHDLDTSFALGREHTGLACKSCHEKWVQGESSIVRYRGIDSDCAACHGLQMNRLKGGR